MKFSIKLALMAIAPIAGAVVIALLTVWSFTRLDSSVEAAVGGDGPLVGLVLTAEKAQLRQSVALERAVLAAMRHGPSDSGFLKSVDSFMALQRRADQRLQGTDATPRLADLDSLRDNYKKNAAQLFSELRAKNDFDVDDLDRHMVPLLANERKLHALIEDLHRDLLQARDTSIARMRGRQNTAQYAILAGALLLFVFGVLSFFGSYRAVIQQLGRDPEELQDLMQRLSRGDLSGVSLGSEGYAATSVYGSLCHMRSSLSETISEAARISALLQSGAAELTVANTGLSERTEQQAANLEETASSAEQIASTVRMNAENANSARGLAEQTSERAEEGGRTALAAVEAMERISEASGQISAITGVIDEIAFQTNLLALNAAVEAARAGEQGRGFAVVATEVRKLAGRSASAAKEIKELIEDSVERVHDGTGLVKNSGAELQDIVKSVNELTTIVSQITKASEEQSLGVGQINQALTELDASTQQNAALVEEAAATSENLAELSGRLNQKVGFFKLR